MRRMDIRQKMVLWGWIDSQGNELGWRYWHRWWQERKRLEAAAAPPPRERWRPKKS
jgi:hypothetical protein